MKDKDSKDFTDYKNSDNTDTEYEIELIDRTVINSGKECVGVEVKYRGKHVIHIGQAYDEAGLKHTIEQAKRYIKAKTDKSNLFKWGELYLGESETEGRKDIED